MKTYKLQRQHKIHTSIDTLWDFFSSAKNLSVLTPSYMNFRVTSGELPEQIYPGQIITYKVSPILGIPLFWMTEITQVIKNKLFVDEQRTGPYKMWHHQHHFEQQDGYVLMTDIVHYQLPFFFLGRIAHALFVKKQLNEIFKFRYQKIEELFNKH